MSGVVSRYLAWLRAQSRSARVESPSKTAACTPGRPSDWMAASWSAASALVGVTYSTVSPASTDVRAGIR